MSSGRVSDLRCDGLRSSFGNMALASASQFPNDPTPPPWIIWQRTISHRATHDWEIGIPSMLLLPEI